jgi:5-methylcytosine-specific restriction endonuclease McrA
MKTLVLNVDYTPLNTINIKRAIILLLKNGAKVIAYYDKEFRSEKSVHKLPAVILYEKYVYRPMRKTPTRHAVLNRDKMTCQYCSTKLNNTNATVDHVIPASMHLKKNDANKWENMVACCKKCNTKKSNKTPHQAGMKLLSKPKRPYHYILGENIPQEWKEFTDGSGI